MLKLQIASLDVLERLIGGDTEIEIELRQSVAENFARKHIKNLAEESGSAIVKRLTEDALNAARNTISNAATNYRPTLSSEYERQINEKVEEVVGKAFAVAVGLQLNKVSGFDSIIKQCQIQADFIVNQLTAKALESRLDKLVDERLKKKLNIG